MIQMVNLNTLLNQSVTTDNILIGKHLSMYEMKSYDELKAEMETIQQQMVAARKNELANEL